MLFGVYCLAQFFATYCFPGVLLYNGHLPTVNTDCQSIYLHITEFYCIMDTFLLWTLSVHICSYYRVLLYNGHLPIVDTVSPYVSILQRFYNIMGTSVLWTLSVGPMVSIFQGAYYMYIHYRGFTAYYKLPPMPIA